MKVTISLELDHLKWLVEVLASYPHDPEDDTVSGIYEVLKTQMVQELVVVEEIGKQYAYFDANFNRVPGLSDKFMATYRVPGMAPINRRIPNAQTNNQAEYYALLSCLAAIPSDIKGIVIVRGDSQLIINQVLGSYQVNDHALQTLCSSVQLAIDQLKEEGIEVTLEWVPREANNKALGL